MKVNYTNNKTFHLLIVLFVLSEIVRALWENFLDWKL